MATLILLRYLDLMINTMKKKEKEQVKYCRRMRELFDFSTAVKVHSIVYK